MPKSIPFYILFFVSCNNLFAQFSVETDLGTGKKGYVNSFDGQVLLPFDFDHISPVINDSLVVATLDKKQGVFDLDGQTIVPMEYGGISFQRLLYEKTCPYASVWKDGTTSDKWGLMDRKGHLVLPMQYAKAHAICSDILVAQYNRDSVLHFFNERGEELFTKIGKEADNGFDANSIEIKLRNRKSYFIQKNGAPYFNNRFPDLRWTDGNLIVCGLALRLGILSLKGDTILPFQYRSINAFGDGNFLVETDGDQKGMVNSQGKFIIPMGQQFIQKWNAQPGSVYTARLNGKSEVSVYDPKGKLLLADCRASAATLPLYLNGISSDQNRWNYLAIGIENNSKVGLMHADGRFILPLEFEYVHYCSDRHPLFAARRNKSDPSKSTLEVYDFNGKKQLDRDFYNLGFTPNPNLILACEVSTRKWAFVFLDKPKAAKFEYESIFKLPAGFFIAKSSAGYQIFDPEMKPLKTERFDKIVGPTRPFYEQFRKQNLKGNLIAVAYRDDLSYPFAINDKCKAFMLQPMNLKSLGIDLTKTGSGGGKVEEKEVEQVVAVMIEAPKPPSSVPEVAEEDLVYWNVDKQPEFPGGESAMLQYLKDNIKYPSVAKENKVEGKVIISFVVERDGTMSDFRISKDIGGGCGAEAERVVRSFPNWSAAERGGKKVRAKYDLSVFFGL